MKNNVLEREGEETGSNFTYVPFYPELYIKRLVAELELPNSVRNCI